MRQKKMNCGDQQDGQQETGQYIGKIVNLQIDPRPADTDNNKGACGSGETGCRKGQ